MLSILAASSGGNPDFFIAGIVITPVAITLPGPEPDKAPIKLLATTDTYPAPPGTLPSSARISDTAPSIIFVLVNMTDIKTNTVIE